MFAKESVKDITKSTVMQYIRDGWPQKEDATPALSEIKEFKKLENSLSVTNGCLLYGNRVVIPASLQRGVLQILHLGHFGMQRMKQLARTAVW